MRRIEILLLLVITFTCSTYADGPCGRVTGKGYDGVIFCEKAHPEGSGWWTPTAKQVEYVESLLPSYIRSREEAVGTKIPDHLSEYKRYYEGVKRNGHRQLDITATHESMMHTRDGRWLKERLELLGGGDNGFAVTYDFQVRKFIEFVINADA